MVKRLLKILMVILMLGGLVLAASNFFAQNISGEHETGDCKWIETGPYGDKVCMDQGTECQC